MRYIFGTGLLALVLTITTTPAHAGVLYGFGPFSGSATVKLYSINTDTGAATFVANVASGTTPGGAAFDDNGVLHALNYSNFFRVDHTTGAYTFIGETGHDHPEGSLVYSIADGVFYGIGSIEFEVEDPESEDPTFDIELDHLFSINPITGIATDLGFLGADGRDVSGLAYVNGTLYGVALNDNDGDTLVTIDTNTVTATKVGDLGLNTRLDNTHSVGGLAYDAIDGKLYWSDSEMLYWINTTTGAATLIGDHSVSSVYISGIASPNLVPEPGSLALLGLAGMVMLKRRAPSAC